MRKNIKIKKLVQWAFIVGILVFMVSGSIDFGNDKRIKLNIKGSTSVDPYVKALKVENEKKFNVKLSAQGSGTGITSLFDGVADIAMSSRDLKPEEEVTAKKKNIEKTVIALDGISVILNKDLPVSNLTLDTLQKIFTGKITNWNQVNKNVNIPINVIARDEASGTREGFDKLVGIKDLALGAKQIEATGEVIRIVAENKGAITYVSSGSTLEGVKPVSVNGIFPNEKNIKSEKYQLYRKFYLLNNKSNKDAEDFVKLSLQKDSQKLLNSKKYKTHFISLINK